jgi:hypothetical protein
LLAQGQQVRITLAGTELREPREVRFARGNRQEKKSPLRWGLGEAALPHVQELHRR